MDLYGAVVTRGSNGPGRRHPHVGGRYPDAWYGDGMPKLPLLEIDAEVPPANPPRTRLSTPGDTLHPFRSGSRDVPRHGRMRLPGDGRPADRHQRLRPRLPRAGTGVPAAATTPGASDAPNRALHDRFRFVDDECRFLFYAGGGVRGTGIAGLALDDGIPRVPH